MMPFVREIPFIGQLLIFRDVSLVTAAVSPPFEAKSENMPRKKKRLIPNGKPHILKNRQPTRNRTRTHILVNTIEDRIAVARSSCSRIFDICNCR